ncbi:MAG: hypothetical protein ACOVJ8_07005, partial [Sediminibacterium sp.]
MLQKAIIFLYLSTFVYSITAQELPFSGTKNKKAEYHFGEALKTFQMQDFDRTQNSLDRALAL